MIAEAAAVFDYEAQPKEPVVCNLCGSEPWVLLGYDRYGYDVAWTNCRCGLTYITPRMTAEAYRRFYESGAYRRLVSAYHGREINAETIQYEQSHYAREVCRFMRPWLKPGMKTHLDVGGSTGLVGSTLRTFFGFGPSTVLDPAPEEIREAALVQHEVILGTAEGFDPAGRTWDLISLCQTVDHLLDIAWTLKKLRGCLSENGLFFVDIVDYDVTREIKIDHPYNLTEKTMSAYLERAGFKEVARERAQDGVHVRFLCAR